MIEDQRVPLKPSDERHSLWATLRRLSWRQWLYLPRLFSRGERIRLAVLILVAATSLGFLIGRLVVRFTVERPAVGGVLREGVLQEPRFINPIYASNDTDHDITNLVFGKLIRYDHQGAIIMDLAESVEASSTDYTVRLRPDVRWHDGEPLSADDVVFTIKTIQDPAYKSPLRQNWQGVSVEKLNERTIRFSLRQPYAPFMENLALGIIPEHLWKKIPRESAVLSDLNLKPVGSGPYRFKKFTRLEDGTITSLVLERNRRFHLPGPYLEEIQFLFYPSEEKLAAAYRANAIDSFVLLSPLPASSEGQIDAELHELRITKLFAVFLNASVRPFLGRKPVRQALAMAIDRSSLIAKTAGNAGVPINSAIPPGTLGFDAGIVPLPYDLAGAKALLVGDGWKATGTEAVFERAEGTGRNRTTQRLEIRLTTSDAPELAKAAELIAEMWRALGVKTDVRILNVNELETSAIRPRAYEALLFGEVFGHDPDPFAFWHTAQLKDPGLNIALYSNPKVDQLLEEARRTSDGALREQKYREFQEIVSDEIGAIFLYSPTHFYVTRKNLQGVVMGTATLLEERFSEANQWYIKTRRALK